MKRMLFNATQASELRVAIVDDKELVDLDIENPARQQKRGNVYKAVVTKVELSLEACFVDYGSSKHGFLPFKEIHKSYKNDEDDARVQDYVREGMEVIVQVDKDERGGKGVTMTTYISLAGRYLVLMTNNPRSSGISRRIEGNQRQELKEILSSLPVPDGMSVIVRTAGIGHSLEELECDLSYLTQLWTSIMSAAEARAPFLIFQESSLVIRAIRDYYQPDIEEILIDTPEYYDQVRSFMSYVMNSGVSKVKLYKSNVPLFSNFQIEKQIEQAHSRKVPLKSGGSLVIDHTEALVSIDVNSAKSTRGDDIEITAFSTNLEAAEEIAKQLRLRDLGGLIVVDFIDMSQSKHRGELEQKMKEFLRYDRARVQMMKLSKFGLMEISRQRLQFSLVETINCSCPRCNGTGIVRNVESAAIHILRMIEDEVVSYHSPRIQVQLPVDVATFILNEQRSQLLAIEDRHKINIIIISNRYIEIPEFHISRTKDKDLSYKSVLRPEANLIPKTPPPNKEEAVVKNLIHPSIDQKATLPNVLNQISKWITKKFKTQQPHNQENMSKHTKAPSHPENSEQLETSKSKNTKKDSQLLQVETIKS